MIVHVKIPPNLLQRLERFAAEAQSMNRDELLFPDWATFVECRELLWKQIDHRTNIPHGQIYINLGQGTLSQATISKVRRGGSNGA